MAAEGDADAARHLAGCGIDPQGPESLASFDPETPALEAIGKLLGREIHNEGHDSCSGLICTFGVDSWAEVKRINDIIRKNTIGGDDEIDVGPYIVARGFHLYPDEGFTNGRCWGVANRKPEGDLDEWLEAYKPTGT